MKLYEICFSPTGGTKKAADFLCDALGMETRFVDLTDSEQDFSALVPEADALAVIAVPSYGGRVPAIAVERLSRIRAKGTKGILVCVR